MSDLPSQATSQSALESFVISLERGVEDTSRANFGLTMNNYDERDTLANQPKQTGANGVLKGADDAREDGSPFIDKTDVTTAVPG